MNRKEMTSYLQRYPQAKFKIDFIYLYATDNFEHVEHDIKFLETEEPSAHCSILKIQNGGIIMSCSGIKQPISHETIHGSKADRILQRQSEGLHSVSNWCWYHTK